MQISKLPLWICALTLCGGFTLHAQDTPAQAAARAALMQKLNDLDTNPPAATPTPAPVQPVPAATAPVTVAPAAEAPATVATPAPAAEIPAEATFTPAAASNSAPVTAVPAATQTAPAGDTAAQAAARAALEQKMQELQISTPAAPKTSVPVETAPVQPSPVASAPAMTTPAMTAPAANPPAQVVGERTIVAPAAPVSMTKEEQLARLLMLYKSNQLTPLEYHDQRAAILAQP
jgi:hypothetical protein